MTARGEAQGGFFLATGGDTQRATERTALMKAKTVPGAVPGDLPAAVWASSAGTLAR